MLRFRLFCILAVIFSPAAFSQWQWLNPLPEGNEYFDATFTNPNTGWVVGGNGSIIHTTDAGLTWVSQNNPLRPTPFLCLNILFTDANTGLISANNSTLLRTSDAGAVWQQLSSEGRPIQKLRRAPDGSIWGFGSVGTVARSTDAGLTWSPLNPGTSSVVFDVAFPDASAAVAVCGSGTIYRSSNGGQQWTQSTLGTAGDVVSVEFISPTHGFALQKPSTLLRTSNGGANWSDTAINVVTVRCIRFADSQTGWLLSNSSGTVLKTENGGLSWRTVTVDPSLRYTFQNVVARSATEALLIGEGGGIFKTTDGGASWTQLGTAFTRAHLSSVAALNDSAAWVFGDGVAQYTDTRGLTWSSNMAGSLPIHSGTALSATRIIAGGTQGQVYFSSDAGVNWAPQVLASLGQINQIKFVDANVGWLAGNHGTVARSSDGGASWSLVSPGTDDYNSVHPVSYTEAWIAGNGGKVMHTMDGGATWTPRNPGTASNLLSIQFTSPTDGWVGGQLVLYRSSDGGITWTPRTLPGLDVVYRIAFTDPMNGFLLFSRGVARTKDGGLSFHRTDYPSTGLRDISAPAGGHVWIAGDFGVVLRYTPAPVVFLNPAELNFGDVATGKSRVLPFTIENTGERPLNTTNLSALGPGFTVQSFGATSLAPGEKDTAEIRFAPAATGIARGLASVASNAALGIPSLPLLGNGVPPGIPALTHEPQILDFGRIRLGTIAGAEVRIRNRGGRMLRIFNERLTGKDSMMFQIGRPSSFLLVDGALDSVQIIFAPLRPEVFTATLLIESDDPAEPAYQIAVRGEATNPKITLIPSTLNFGYVFTDSTKTLYLEIKNEGTAELLTANHRLQGKDANDFSFIPPPSNPIGPGSSVLIPITFHPKTLGEKTATLYVESSDIINPAVSATLIGRPTNAGTDDLPGLSLPLSFDGLHPNPIGPGTAHRAMLTVTLREAAVLRVRMTNVLGREVAQTQERWYEAGTHQVMVAAGDVPTGAYMTRIEARYRNGRIETAGTHTRVVR